MTSPQFKTEEDVYRELGRVLGRAPNEIVWRLLVEDGWPGDVIDPLEPAGPEAVFAELVEKYRQTEHILSESSALNGQRRRMVPTEKQSSAPASPALDALSEVMALEAQSHPLVLAFRKRVLGGACLQYAETEAWQLANSKQMKLAWQPGSWPPFGARENAYEARVDAERYATGKLAASGREADFLGCVVEVLREAYGWPGWDDIATFVLSGETPRLPSATAWVRVRGRFFPKSASVHLIVNPQMEPRRLMDLYAQMRHTNMAPNTRIRPPGVEASRLAVFAARHNDGSTWQDVWAAWNAEGGKQYTDVRSFTRDARLAYLRVTGEKLEWKNDKTTDAPARAVTTNERGRHDDTD